MTMSDRQIRAMFRDARQALDPAVERRVLAAAARDRRGGRAEVDGFKSSHKAGGGRGGSELTSVESAAQQRAWPSGKRERDIVAEHVEQMVGFLEQATSSAQAMGTRCTAVEKTAEDAPELGRCCEWHQAAGIVVEGDLVYGDMGGRLPRPMDLCSACRGFGDDVLRGKRRPQNEGEILPTHDQVCHHHETGRWRIRVADSRSTVGTGGAFEWRDHG